MEDQSPLAILEYIKQTGIKQVELMGNHAEPFAGAPESPINDPSKMAVLIKQYRKEPLTEDEKVIAAEVAAMRETYNAEVAAWRKDVDFKKFEELKVYSIKLGFQSMLLNLAYLEKPMVMTI